MNRTGEHGNLLPTERWGPDISEALNTNHVIGNSYGPNL
jgi:hypothetical protein